MDFYNIAGASAGLQLGAQKQSVVLMFMTEDSFKKFRASSGWKAGVDGSVAIIETGAGKELSTQTLQQPIIGFVFSNKGLMAGITLEGSKVTKIQKP
jgi:lipid-binding SYLF domain-containing protein